MDPIVKHAISIQHRIQMALNTEETGDDLVFVARTAREAELTLARIERLLDAAGSNLQALIAMLEDKLEEKINAAEVHGKQKGAKT